MKRYYKVFIIVIVIMIGLLLLEKMIPNNKSRININKSYDYYNNYYNDQKSNIYKLFNNKSAVDINGELSEISIIYLESNKKYYSELVEMNRDSYVTNKIVNHRSFNELSIDSDYARYWHGSIIFLKPLLTFFNMNTINKIYFIVFSIIFCILVFKLLQNSKLLNIGFVLSTISINMFLVTKCINLMYDFIIAMIGSILVIRKYEKKDINIDIIFLVIGMLTAYLDMITCETITLTLPLFIYIYLYIKDNKKIDYKLLFKVIILWLLGYIGTYIVKWLLLVIHYHGEFFTRVIDPLKVRIDTDESFFSIIKDAFNFIIPYNNTFKILFIIISIISIIINYILDNKNRINILFLILLSIIPFIRYFVLLSHSSFHNYFTYRAFIPFILLLIMNDLLFIFKLIKKGINI